MLNPIQNELRVNADPEKAKIAQRFFKTGPGQYGEGDIFLGFTVPELRKMAKKYRTLSLKDLKTLIQSTFHEERLAALMILRMQYERGDALHQKACVDFYLKHKKYVNNWDLVDASAPYILGHYLRTKDKSILYELAISPSIWDRRISMLATFNFIKHHEFPNTLEIAKILMNDKHDLIHKAVGWMLREIGNRDQAVEKQFLDTHAHHMPRTMLRYAIEKFSPEERRCYLGPVHATGVRNGGL